MYRSQFDFFRQTGKWPYGLELPYDTFLSSMGEQVRKMVNSGQAKLGGLDVGAQQEESARNFEALGANMKEAATSVSMEGQEAIDFDAMFSGAVASAKRKTPLITSVAGMPAKRSATHE